MEDETNEPAFHSGERTVQRRVGYAERMSAVGERAIRKHMPEQHRQFLGQLPFVLVGSIDQAGQPWASVLSGAPGFVHSPDTVHLRIMRAAHRAIRCARTCALEHSSAYSVCSRTRAGATAPTVP